MSLFGGMPFPVQFFLAFIVVLGLIGVAAWLVRRLGAGRLGGVGMRGRQPRLAVVDYASVDGRRRLILVRRDNVEHLVMIGGPSDIVVESNIVRATPATREVAMARPPAMAEPPQPRAIPVPMPEPAANTGWPSQAEAAVPPAAPRMARSEPVPEEPAAWPLQPQAETQPRAPRDTLAALADELSTRPAAPQRTRPQVNARPQPPEPRPEVRAEPKQEVRQEPRQESRQESRQELRPEPIPEPRIAAAAPPATSDAAAAADRSLAEMAQQLEAALRKPTAKTERSEPREPRMPSTPRAVAPGESSAPAPAVAAPPPNGSAQRNARTPEVKPPVRPDAKQAPAGKALYDSLEQEMASLLGRPTAKN
ncbi:MAG: flagellar biosynthetic protein FliO [Xanthobacteraceae bacterium]